MLTPALNIRLKLMQIVQNVNKNGIFACEYDFYVFFLT